MTVQIHLLSICRVLMSGWLSYEPDRGEFLNGIFILYFCRPGSNEDSGDVYPYGRLVVKQFWGRGYEHYYTKGNGLL